MVRSFLLPLTAYQELTTAAVATADANLVAVNIRGELEPNVFVVPAALVGARLAEVAVPGS